MIIPLYNAERMVARCLAPLVAMRDRGEISEIIVVDDGSTDDSADIVRQHESVQLVAMDRQRGPGAARNRGADIAIGAYLWFVDSDVVVAEDAARVLARTVRETGAAAVFGRYDDRPAATNFLSQYKNLAHHYYHSLGSENASTFWAGCGAVERQLFNEVGRFDAERYRHPSIEDIELGYRIREVGGRIILQRSLQGKHLKEWRLYRLLHTEIFRRAVPWSQLMLERRSIMNDLNVGTAERMRALLALATTFALCASLAGLASPWLSAVLAATTVGANRGIIGFFRKSQGLPFAVKAFLFHQLYYMYSSFGFGLATAQHLRAATRASSASASLARKEQASSSTRTRNLLR